MRSFKNKGRRFYRTRQIAQATMRDGCAWFDGRTDCATKFWLIFRPKAGVRVAASQGRFNIAPVAFLTRVLFMSRPTRINMIESLEPRTLFSTYVITGL